MKKNIFFKQILLPSLLVFVFNTMQAQDALIASGSNISGSGGSVSYSVGQIVQETNIGTNGSAIQGIQFYFDATSLAVVDIETNLNISTYPNPTSSILNITIDGKQDGKLSYSLFNLLGALITSGDIKNNTVQINIEDLPMATYLLKLSNSNNNIKTFKIIKN
ncbi:T9SS type A sorting domain-containing protein [Thalassobellus citreus]|uniref:T9SS type A sorting domain-containing protein n=1 Tax=Thalassobellus citreus TaxID=3367752 RepID=UPI00378C8B89